jgi:hypothetical protein
LLASLLLGFVIAPLAASTAAIMLSNSAAEAACSADSLALSYPLTPSASVVGVQLRETI